MTDEQDERPLAKQVFEIIQVAPLRGCNATCSLQRARVSKDRCSKDRCFATYESRRYPGGSLIITYFAGDRSFGGNP